jgi:hypothetical protein
VLNLILSISGTSALTTGVFVALHVLMIGSLCSLYMTYLFFLTRKRLRTGLYGTFANEE